MITLLNIETDEQVTWTLEQVLIEINRDKANGWKDYDESDWREGIEYFTQWQLVDNKTQGE